MIEKLQRFKVNLFFHSYLSQVKHIELEKELIDSIQILEELMSSLTPNKLVFAYAPNKWTIAEVIGHCIDTEIIFGYRALTIARSDERVDLPGFDENEFASNMNMVGLSGPQLCQYAIDVRQSTLNMLKTISHDQLIKTGMANNSVVQVEALFYIISGHLRHHVSVIKHKYLG